MAQPIIPTGALTSGALLRAIPAAQQTAVAKDLLANLKGRFDDAAASIVIELVSGQEDHELESDLLDVLEARIIAGEPQAVASLVQQLTKLSSKLLGLAADRLTAVARYLLDTPGSVVAGFSSKIKIAELDVSSNASSQARSDTATQWLLFTKRLSTAGIHTAHEDVLFPAALCLLGALDKSTALAARELVFSLLESYQNKSQSAESLPSVTSALITAQDSSLHQTLGYSLWLRRIAASDNGSALLVDISPKTYWQSILVGLRYGDTERRKLSLDILKRSVAIAIEQDRTDLVTNNRSPTPTDIIVQYSRYCSVFETLVLARYTNLLAECENDLALLASPTSVVNLEWLFVLLGTGLDARTQDQNRRFLGKWILDSSMRMESLPTGFAALLENEFLPWVTEGTLLVSSTKQHEDKFRCFHGEKLAEFVRATLQERASNPLAAEMLVYTILRYLTRRKNAMFAYAAVHILRGVGKAFEANDSFILTTEQLEYVLDISSWRIFPEVASDFLLMQCHKLLTLSMKRSADSLTQGLSAIGHTRSKSLQAMAYAYNHPNVDVSQETEETAFSRSHRDVAIIEAITKCHELAKYVDNTQPPINSEVQDRLEDIWTDLEFLEFPRDLLMQIPDTILHIGVLETALLEPEDNELGLRAFLTKTLPRLQDLTAKRSFILAPLVVSMRAALLQVPNVASIFDVPEFLFRVAQNPPEVSTDLKLEYASISTLQEVTEMPNRAAYYFGQGEGHGFAAYLDLISRLGGQQPELIRSLIENTLDKWKRQKVPPPTMSQWKTTLQLQLLLLCLEQYTAIVDAEALQSIIKDLFYILSIEPLPRYRYLMEWMVARMQIRHRDLQVHVLRLMSTKDHHSNPKFLASLMKIGILLASTADCTPNFALQLATAFIALSSSSKIVIRHEAQWSFPLLMDYAKARGWESITNNPAYTALDDYIRSLPRFDDPPPERLMGKLDPIEDNTMTNLVEGLWTDLDYTRPPYARREDFVQLLASDNENNYPPSCMPLGSALSRPPRPLPQTADFAPKPLLGPKQMTQDEAIALQTKGTAYLKSALTSPDSPKQQTHSLLLVASLIENPYNLGGLSRCAEIFGAQALYVRDPRVIAEKDFTSVAVSSHNHVDIQPCPMPELSAFLGGKKEEGWTVVGIEQTDRSVLVGAKDCDGREQCMLPQKTILVLGSEREGMPATVLSECDMLVEIPQLGVTRSLNVQTAAAIVLFEYGRQHKLAKKDL